MFNFVGDKISDMLQQCNNTVSDLAVNTDISSNQWARVIKGSSRLSVDMAIRLGIVFPGGDEGPWLKNQNYWIYLQYKSDICNAGEMRGPMYRNIKVWAAVNEQ